VLESPQHLEQLGPLLATFPDATIDATDRDPLAVVQSAATMLAYGARMNCRTPRPEWCLAYWTDRIRQLLEASVRDRGLLPAQRTVGVPFHEFMADDLATVEQIYEVAGLAMTDAARVEMAAYVRDHPRGREGQVVYDLRRDFAEPAAVREPRALLRTLPGEGGGLTEIRDQVDRLIDTRPGGGASPPARRPRHAPRGQLEQVRFYAPQLGLLAQPRATR
jgi:Sulfotransferase family